MFGEVLNDSIIAIVSSTCEGEGKIGDGIDDIYNTAGLAVQRYIHARVSGSSVGPSASWRLASTW